MKKILFITLAVSAFSNFASAQDAAAFSRPAPSADQKSSKTKGESATKANVAREKTVVTVHEKSASNQKSSTIQSPSLQTQESLQSLDDRKIELEQNTLLTPDERKKGLEAIETERKAVLVKSMGALEYKKYLQQKELKLQVKPVKSN